MAVEAIRDAIVGKIVEKCIDPIMRQFQYLFCYRSNVETLRNGIKKLEQTRTEVQRLVDAATNNGEEIKPIVTDWLRQAYDLEKEAHTTISDGMETVKADRLPKEEMMLKNISERANLMKLDTFLHWGKCH
nr:uncharacterized protein LOC113696559 [Coffea arabica]